MFSKKSLINDFVEQAKLYGDFLVKGSIDDVTRCYAALEALLKKIHKDGSSEISKQKVLLTHDNGFVRLWSVALLQDVFPNECKNTLDILAASGGIIGETARLNMERFAKRLEYSLIAVVDSGAVQWKIGSIEKYCSVFAAKAYLGKYGPVIPDLGDRGRFIIQKLAEASKALEARGVPMPQEFNFQFHLKTCETFIWFADQNHLPIAELIACVEFAEGHYKSLMMDKYGS